MRRKLLFSGAAALIAIGLAGVGGYVYFFSSLRSSPPSLALSAPPTGLATASTGLAGTGR